MKAASYVQQYFVTPHPISRKDLSGLIITKITGEAFLSADAIMRKDRLKIQSVCSIARILTYQKDRTQTLAIKN